MKIPRYEIDIHPELLRYLKFSLAGFIGVPVNFAALYLLTEVAGLHYIASAAIGFLFAGMVIFIVQTKWTFRDTARKDKAIATSYGKFMIVRGLGELIYLGILVLLTEKLGLWYMLSAAIAMVLAFPVKYVIDSWWVWNRKVWKWKTRNLVSNAKY